MLSLFRWAALRQDFKEVLPDLLCVISVGLADEPNGIRQQHMTFCFLRFALLPLFVFLICDLLHFVAPPQVYYHSKSFQHPALQPNH